jgi:murein DD-endopeptidase MepM/ murein hydrolase activator NlpD
VIASILYALLLLLMVQNSSAYGAAAAKTTGAKPLELLQGEVAELRLPVEAGSSLQAWMGKEPIHFFPGEDGWHSALIGADVEAKPGTARIIVRMMSAQGTVTEKQIDLRIKTKAFKTESFKVDPGFDQMTSETLAEIRRERTAFAQAYAAGTTERLWEIPFVRPVPHAASASSFGFRRIINGVPRAPHSGTDLSAPTGTEVVATNHGRVVLVGNFFFAGGSIVLDHGAGLHTMYFHLSEFKVEEGTTVRRGDVIALSGMTGRVTGPHLHWGARMAGARVDPLQLLEKLGGKETARAGREN